MTSLLLSVHLVHAGVRLLLLDDLIRVPPHFIDYYYKFLIIFFLI